MLKELKINKNNEIITIFESCILFFDICHFQFIWVRVKGYFFNKIFRNYKDFKHE